MMGIFHLILVGYSIHLDIVCWWGCFLRVDISYLSTVPYQWKRQFNPDPKKQAKKVIFPTY